MILRSVPYVISVSTISCIVSFRSTHRWAHFSQTKDSLSTSMGGAWSVFSECGRCGRFGERGVAGLNGFPQSSQICQPSLVDIFVIIILEVHWNGVVQVLLSSVHFNKGYVSRLLYMLNIISNISCNVYIYICKFLKYTSI